MIVKNHNIVLEDTSPAEMARFRQIFKGIWLQQVEDEKNAVEMENFIKEHYATAKALDAEYANNPKKPEEITLKEDHYILNNDNHYEYVNAIALKEVVVTISPLDSILIWIKKNLGNKATELKQDSLPKSTQLKFLSDTNKGHVIDCNRYQFEAIVDLMNIEFAVYFKTLKTFFLLGIFDSQKNLVFRLETNTYEGLQYLAEFIGYDLGVFKTTITQQYKIALAAAGNDKDKLDSIYEVIPDFILKEIKTDQQMYSDIWTLLDQDISDIGGRDEDQGILNILKTLQKKDAKKLFKKLHERPFWIMKLYETFSGEDRKNFVALIMTISKEFNSKIPNKNNYAVIPDGYWLEKHALETSWTSKGLIEIKGYGQVATNIERLIINALPALGPTPDADAVLKAPPIIGTDRYIEEVITPLLTVPTFSPNPMDFVPVRTIAAISKEETLLEETQHLALFLKYTTDELSDKLFWDVVNVASTLAGGYGAVRVLTLKGVGWFLKTAAVIELSKAVVDLVMLNDNAKKALKDAGLGILVDNWTTISITTDLAFLSLDGLFALAKIGKKGAKILKEANEVDQAAHLEKQTEKAFEEIEKQTGVDVSKMSEKEIDKLVEEIKLKAGKKGKWNNKLNRELKPNVVYDVDGYLYKTDDLGRVKSVEAKLSLESKGRNKYQQGKSVAIKDGVKGQDDGGHLIAQIFNGPGEQINYLPQKSTLNRGDWKAMENKWAKALEENKEVHIEINNIFEGNSKRPSLQEVKFKIDGKQFKEFFEN